LYLPQFYSRRSIALPKPRPANIRISGYNQAMVRELEAVFENGVLRPLEPLSLVEKQRVHVTITDLPALESTCTRKTEQKWLGAHGHEYPGQWVALHGDVLLGHGLDARAVRDEARRKGIHRPLLVHVPDEPDQPSAGWL
jgi:predicted DNA-binding antitoxin AbrB/MazE fold protein